MGKAGGIGTLWGDGTATGATDGQLLERFRSRSGPSDRKAEAAFEALAGRHAAMVWGVCLRASPSRADAEDAFQATFLVLVRKAAWVREDGRGSIGGWLYGVARKVAGRHRTARRLAAAIEVPTSTEDPPALAERREARAVVSAELGRLDARFRRPIELCDLDGLTYAEAALALGWPTATVKSRLARGRARLRDRLARRGLAPLAAVALSDLARECRAGAPTHLVSSTTRAATLASGLLPTAVARLAEGAIRTMTWQKFQPLALLAVEGVGLGASSLAVSSPRRPEPVEQPPPAARPRADDDSDARWSRRLPDGRALEILGVSSLPAGPSTWWTPDGRPIAAAPFELSEPSDRVRVDEGQTRRAIVYRLEPAPDGAVQGSVDQAIGTGGRDVSTAGGGPAPDLAALVVTLPDPTPSLTVRFRLTSSAWKTAQTFDAHPCALGAGAGRSLVSSGAIADRDGGTNLCVAHDVGPEEDYRAVAVDRDDREHTAKRMNDFSGGGVGQLTARFDVPPEAIREFRLQTRPYEQVVMPDVAAGPSPADPR